MINTMLRLNGKVVLISGVASGMGAAQARLFAREGACIIGGDIQDSLGHAVIEEIQAAGGKARYIHLDVTDENHWQSAVDLALSDYHCLTTLLNTAGVFLRDSALDVDIRQSWTTSIAVNQQGVFFGMRAAIPALVNSGDGAIVNVGSVLSIRGGASALSYQTSKAAILGMTRGAAVDLATAGVRVNAILPGLILTPMTVGPNSNTDVNKTARRIPLGYGGSAEDIANAALFLASDEAKYITGIALPVDGGWTAAS